MPAPRGRLDEAGAAEVPGCPSSPAQGQFNAVLRAHACSKAGWNLQQLAQVLYGWAERFDRHFGLNVSPPAIAIHPMRSLGTYRPSPNGFGIDDEVVISSRHLDRPFAEVLRTLLHEMVHQWQHHHGRPGRGHHNLEFRAKCAALGIPTDVRGRSLGIVGGGPFDQLLLAHGVAAADRIELNGAAARATPPGSKLKKWRCQCTNVRCAVQLQARCERCGARFERMPDKLVAPTGTSTSRSVTTPS